jgi:SPP1 family holin
MNISKGTIIRTACLVLAIINNGLALFGKSPLPIDDEILTQVVSFLFTTGAALAAWWKNNSFTPEAIEADQVLHGLKSGVK